MNHKTSIVKRIFERGNQQERQEIIRVYGTDDVSKMLEHSEDLLPGWNTKKQNSFFYNYVAKIILQHSTSLASSHDEPTNGLRGFHRISTC